MILKVQITNMVLKQSERPGAFMLFLKKGEETALSKVFFLNKI